MSKDKNKITKFKCFLDLDKELEYINEMNKQGWKLVYIKGGIFFTFVRTQPDKYFTVTYTVDKEEVSTITTFAAQCGYESIPHTMDGFGDMLYLTGKKDEVSQEFVSDRDAQIESCKKMHKKLFILTLLNMIPTAMMLLETISMLICGFTTEFDTIVITLTAIIASLTILYASIDVVMGLIVRKYKKKIKVLENEAAIYE